MISDDKYSFRNSENLQQRIQMHLFKEQNLFRIFLHDFWNLLQFLNILKKWCHW